MAAMKSLLVWVVVVLAVSQAASARLIMKDTITAANTSSPTNATVQAAVVARTIALGTPSNYLNATTAASFLANDFAAFAANVSGPLTLANNASAILGYLATNSLLATAKNPLANVSSPIVKQFILIDPTSALITAQIPALQHFGTILWTYLNSTNVSSADWYAKTAIFTPAPISIL